MDPDAARVAPPWAASAEAVLRDLDAGRAGLSSDEASDRLRRWGPNELRRQLPRSWLSVLVAQLRSIIVGLLAVAAGVSFTFGRPVEGGAIAAVIVLNTAIGFAMELRATRSMEALRQLGQVTARVRRSGDLLDVPAQMLVPGDIVVLDAGDVVTSDVRLLEANKLAVDESALTGEFMPVSKHLVPVDEDTGIGDRTCMLFKGTVVTRGSGEGVVVATGAATELGKIARLVEETEDETTPLEQRLDALGRRLLWLTAVIAVLVATSGLVTGRDLLLVVETAIALAVATVPEGLPVVATLALARGMWRMARRNALVRRLSAVETLGSTSVILTDKTGTLTENRMTVTRIVTDAGEWRRDERGTFERDGSVELPASDEILRRALRIGVLCNNADLHPPSGDGDVRGVGDPLEIALLDAGARVALDADALLAEAPELREEAFDPETKMMATFHEGQPVLVAVKGAPEAVIAVCTHVLAADGERPLDAASRLEWTRRNQDLAAHGLRLLALAEKRVAGSAGNPYEALTLLGLVGMVDPPRAETAEVVRTCRAAGVRLVMVTGDQPATASYVAEAVGLATSADAVCTGAELEAKRGADVLGVDVVARTSPKQKLDIIRAYQRAGAVVAMIGDGVNDAPALRKADIGVAMGKRGTQVAREAADMVLRDDALGTIAVAIREGRIIFDNIRKFAVYLLSCNISELLAVGCATLVGLPLPLLPLQILFLNLVTDVFPALALGACNGEADVMERPPRPAGEAVLTRSHWWAMGGYGVVITVAVLASLWAALEVLGLPKAEAVTVSFLTLGFAQTWHVFNVRPPRSHPLWNEVTRNGWVWGAIVVCVVLLIAAVYLPGIDRVLGTRTLGADGWLLVIVASLVPLAVGQVLKGLPASRDRGVPLTGELDAQEAQ